MGERHFPIQVGFDFQGLPVKREIQAIGAGLRGLFAIHRTHWLNEHGIAHIPKWMHRAWTVSHIRTGYCVTSDAPTKAVAIQIVRAMEGLPYNWHFDHPGDVRILWAADARKEARELCDSIIRRHNDKLRNYPC